MVICEYIIVFSDTFKVGDLVILHEDEDFVANQTCKLSKSGSFPRLYSFLIKEITRTMLGKTYPIVPSESSFLDENWARLLNDDGKKYYFPKTTLWKVKRSKWT